MAFNKRNTKVTKFRKRDVYLITAIINLCWYTIVALILTAFNKTIPDSLTVAWFSAWTVELAIVAGIKITERNNTNVGTGNY